MIIGVDFDGTCVSNEFPKIGQDIGSVPVLKEIVNNGHQLILVTMRSDMQNAKSVGNEILAASGNFLTDALNWFFEHRIPLYGVNCNPTQHNWTSSPKAYCQLFIDDAALGCPLTIDPKISYKPFVDWEAVRGYLIVHGIINPNIVKEAS
jgi:hypothetical protein